MSPPMDARESPAGGRTRALGWLFAIAVAIGGTCLRARTALSDPDFNARDPAGMLKSDPGLLDYFVERILASHGLPPPDFRADPRVEHPELTDVPATFAIGQEFVVAWGFRLFGGGVPLHVFCVWIMGACASLCALGVYGLALELSGSAVWAALAAFLCAALPASYRTIGFILVNEDFSVPWFALHLWLLARAVRLRTPGSIALAGLALGVAVSTWHATSFLFALEAACVFAWFACSGRNPLSARGAFLLPAVLLAFAFVVPVLRTTGFAFSIGMQIVLALAVAAAWTRARTSSHRAASSGGALAVALIAWASMLGASLSWAHFSGGGQGEYSHVFGLVWEKLLHLGRLPADPNELAPEVRLMWQGPFATLDPALGAGLLGLSLLGLLPAAAILARAARRPGAGAPDDRLVVLCAFACLSIPTAWLVERTVFLPALLLPVVLAGAGAGSSKRGLAVALVGAGAILQAILCLVHFSGFASPWYRPAQRQLEIAAMVKSLPRFVPEGEAVAADFMNSTAILANTGRPIVFQPKWESRRSRERAVEFLATFFHGTPDRMRSLLLEKYRCRYVLFDRFTLGILRASRYSAGLRDGDPLPPGSCAAVFLSRDEAVLRGVPGYRLLYRSPETIRQSDGSTTDFFRLYELVP